MTRIIRISCAVICIAITLVILNGQLQAAGPRNWKNKKGKKIHASFVDLVVKKQDGTESEIIILERSSDKRVFEIPLEVLSSLDQKIVRKYLDHAENKKRKAEQEANRNTPKDGKHAEYYESGKKKSEAHYKNGKKDGLLTKWRENGQKASEVHYKNGKKDGRYLVFDGYGQAYFENHYRNGKQDGRQDKWFPANGQKWWERNYKDGKPEGLWTSWYKNGQKNQEVHWQDGRLMSASAWKWNGDPCPITKVVNGSGSRILYHYDGDKEVEEHYKDGKPEGLWTKWVSDHKFSEDRYKDGKREGLWTSWYLNGNKQSETHFKNDTLDGRDTEWYENGQKSKERHYNNGQLVSASVWKPDGEPCPITEIVDGSGIIVDYYPSGQVVAFTFKNSKYVSKSVLKTSRRIHHDERLTERIQLPNPVTLSFLKNHLMNKTMLQVKAALGPPTVALNDGWVYAIAFVDMKSEQRYKNVAIVFKHDLQDKNKTGPARAFDISGLQFLPSL